MAPVLILRQTGYVLFGVQMSRQQATICSVSTFLFQATLYKTAFLFMSMTKWQLYPFCLLIHTNFFCVQGLQTSHYPPELSHPYFYNHSNHLNMCPWRIQNQCHGFKAGYVSVSTIKDFSNCLQSESEIRKLIIQLF